MKHTPGPWEFNPLNDAIERKEPPEATIAEFSIIRRRGDAVLMAAAPEMYELLVEVAANPATNYGPKIVTLLQRIKGED